MEGWLLYDTELSKGFQDKPIGAPEFREFYCHLRKSLSRPQSSRCHLNGIRCLQSECGTEPSGFVRDLCGDRECLQVAGIQKHLGVMLHQGCITTLVQMNEDFSQCER